MNQNFNGRKNVKTCKTLIAWATVQYLMYVGSGVHHQNKIDTSSSGHGRVSSGTDVGSPCQ